MAVDRIFDALASRPRREILAYLSAQELTAGEIGARFSMSAPAISRHLSVLEAAGLVASEKRGQYVFYRLVPDNLVNTLTGFAFEICPTAGPLRREARARAKTPARAPRPPRPR
ncbi:MAG TPA: metalloregulator ArsR/SmtB family transcription factor [Pseudoxanthomonas sp.]|nr:metalloregulator ArsR/SmtB family transcription factor [Pseudoxanthomonas sp.]